MASSSLFAGVVTHPRSRFNEDAAAARMLDALAGACAAQGLPTSVLVSDRDDYDPAAYPITRRMLVQSARYQADLEHRWRRYLADAGGTGRSGWSDAFYAAAMSAKRLADYVGAPWTAPGRMPGAAAVTRLLNIDLSHLRILDEGAAREAPWILVLEDDAGMQSAETAALLLRWLTEALADTDVSFVSLSQSLSPAVLGVAPLLAPAQDVQPPDELGATVLRAATPVTNTVCATFYRADYAAALAAEIRRQGLVPVAPIDWRVNAAILALVSRGVLGPQSCVWVEPGPFVQRSMLGEVPGSARG